MPAIQPVFLMAFHNQPQIVLITCILTGQEYYMDPPHLQGLHFPCLLLRKFILPVPKQHFVHVKQVGFLKTLPVLFRLLILAAFNLPIFKRGKARVYHFMTREEIELLIETNMESVYAAQDWFGVYLKKDG